MKILYDHQMFSIQRFGGVSRYFSELMKNIPSEHRFKLALIFSDNYYLKENFRFFKKSNVLGDNNFKGKYYVKQALSSINHYYSTRCIASGKFDLFHPTYYNNYFLRSLKKPYVITVHDLILFKFEHTFSAPIERKRQMENAIKRANRIIAISENTKKDLIEILKINPDKIDVVYHGYTKASPAKKSLDYGKYILYVGRRGLYKNFLTFVKAISTLLNREKEIKLVCVGPPFDHEEMTVLTNLKMSDQAIAINVDDHTLNDLYAGALVFVYPSVYEGFGMPILEAFANNCPVCLSDASCFPEIAGSAGVYFDPYSHESILSAVQKVIYDEVLRKAIVEAGQRRLTNFSWEKTAAETICSYKRTV
ncbi:MAG TPA: glycosyltransferase family 1 protein [Flavitalea sp.]|nr:glycosyltransferase family 1 protein [Flavitalea sp.]